MTPEQIADRESVWERMAKEHPEFTRAMDPTSNYHTVREIVLGGSIPWAGVHQRFTPFPGAKVMDVGANVGIYSAFCAANGALVTAYEPHAAAYEELWRMALDCDLRIRARQFAVSTHDGVCKFVSHINPDAMCTWYNGGINEKDGQEVPCVSFDTAIGDDEFDCVKMDIEGGECEALLMASVDKLKQIKFMYVEFHPWSSHGLHDETIKKLESVFYFEGAYWNPQIERWEAAYCTRK